MFFQKHDPRATYFDGLIQLMTECGIKDYLYRRALPYQDMKDHKENKNERLKIEHFYLVLFAGTVGGLLASIAFIVEKRSVIWSVYCLLKKICVYYLLIVRIKITFALITMRDAMHSFFLDKD